MTITARHLWISLLVLIVGWVFYKKVRVGTASVYTPLSLSQAKVYLNQGRQLYIKVGQMGYS